MDQPRIIEAVASMTSHGILGQDAAQNRRIMDAMVAAVVKCQADGVTDLEVLRQAQLDARDKVLGGGG